MPAPTVPRLVDPRRQRLARVAHRLLARVLGVTLVVGSAYVFLDLLGR